ncbi:MAG: M12 family metallo-peptidase [Ginsengibacter sp.]
MKKLIIIFLLASATQAFSQDWPLKKLVTDRLLKNIPFIQMPGFSFVSSQQLADKGVYQAIKINADFSRQLLAQKPDAVQVEIPLDDNETLVVNLIKFDLGNIKFTENNNQNEVVDNLKIPVTYRGIISGDTSRNNVVLTVNEDYVSMIATSSKRTIQITKADGLDKSLYRLYNSDKVQFPKPDFDCGTIDKPLSKQEELLLSLPQQRSAAPPDKCVNVFVDCFDSLYYWKNSSYQQTINYVYELFNAVAAGYTNEQINIQIIAVNVWTTPDPYRGDTRANALADLAANYKDNFWGNICVGLDYGLNTRSGLASIASAKGMAPNTCPAYSVATNPFCYCDVNYTSIATVKNFPTGPSATGAAIYLVMHEMGHLLGSRHTKWCGWQISTTPLVYGALDSCGIREVKDNVTPLCSAGPPPPATGATIMSYCVSNNTASDFVNYNNGFGPLPGNAIRTFVYNNSCIAGCLVCITGMNNPLKKMEYSFNDNNSIGYKNIEPFSVFSLDHALDKKVSYTNNEGENAYLKYKFQNLQSTYNSKKTGYIISKN